MKKDPARNWKSTEGDSSEKVENLVHLEASYESMFSRNNPDNESPIYPVGWGENEPYSEEMHQPGSICYHHIEARMLQRN